VKRALAVLALALIGCGDGDPAVDDPVVMVSSEGCGDAFFWATSADDTVGMTLYLDVRDRDPAVESRRDLGGADVEVIRGERLSRNQCTDVIDMDAEPSSTHGVETIAGEVVVPAGPIGTCPSDGTLRVDELVAEDGTTFAPFEVHATGIGCYSG
jgi:hypothetical protein